MSPEIRRHISNEFLEREPYIFHSRTAYPSEEIWLPDRLIRIGNCGPEFIGDSSLTILLGEMGIHRVSKNIKGMYWYYKHIDLIQDALRSGYARASGYLGSPPMKWSRDDSSQKTSLIISDTQIYIENDGVVINVEMGPNYRILLETLAQPGEILLPRTQGGRGETGLKAGLDSRESFEKLGFHDFRTISFTSIHDGIIDEKMSPERKQAIVNENNNLLTYALRYERNFYLCTPPANSEVNVNSIGAIIKNTTDLYADHISIMWRPKWKFCGVWVDAMWSVRHKRIEILP